MAPRRSDDEPEKPEAEPTPSVGQKVADSLLKSRTILLFGEITQKVAQATVMQLLALGNDSDEPIRLIINSQGGHVESGDSIHDMVRFVRPKVIMVGTGWVASAGCHIFLAVDRADRFCLPNTRFMIHQPAGGAGGRASDIAIQAKEIIKTRERIAKVVARETGHKLEKVLADMERDYWMSAEEAVGYGIVSRIIERQKDLA